MDESKYRERLRDTGRNDACPCGSGKKYKKCHMSADEAKSHEDSAKLQEEMAAAADETDGGDKEQHDESDQKKKPDRSGGRSRVPRYTGGKGKSNQSIPRRSAV